MFKDDFDLAFNDKNLQTVITISTYFWVNIATLFPKLVQSVHPVLEIYAIVYGLQKMVEFRSRDYRSIQKLAVFHHYLELH